MNIVLTNDDGIHAPGIWALATELSTLGRIILVAPDEEMSGVGTSVPPHSPVRMREVKSDLENVTARAVQGTPGHCVVLAINRVLGHMPDLVVSGVNEGPNFGDDVYISGTVGGAIHGFFYGIPSIAVSLANMKGSQFACAAKVAGFLAGQVQAGSLRSKLVLNVNVPDVAFENLEGMEVTRLGDRRFTDVVEEGHDGKRTYYWLRRGPSQWTPEPGTDVWAVERNRVSVTPLFGDREARLSRQLDSAAGSFAEMLAMHRPGP